MVCVIDEKYIPHQVVLLIQSAAATFIKIPKNEMCDHIHGNSEF